MTARSIPSREVAEAILIEQRGCCLYCLQPLDSWVYKDLVSIDLVLNWDHIKPYVYLQGNPEDNWAASCQICNSIKSDLHFKSIESAREYITRRRHKLGYTVEKPHWKEQDKFESISNDSINSVGAVKLSIGPEVKIEIQDGEEITETGLPLEVASPLEMNYETLVKHMELRHSNSISSSGISYHAHQHIHRVRRNIEWGHIHVPAICDACGKEIRIGGQITSPRKWWPDGMIFCSSNCGQHRYRGDFPSPNINSNK